MDRPLRADRLGRAVALLALVVGLLAMHGVAGAHHAAAEAPSHTSTVHAAVPTEHGAAHVDPVPAGAPVAFPTPSSPDCGDDCEPGVATLCVAVLAVTAIAVAAGLVARSRTGTSLASERPRARAPVVLRLPPRLDPVAELCVSRT
ncbi:MAG: hypothetical protein Q8R60_17840 [Mycobacteriales bacterium]|nr:hypothetical protein [Mycobacteriales bacterium]